MKQAILGLYLLILCDIEGVRSEAKPPSIFVSVLIRQELKIFQYEIIIFF